jgi:hypothetical protein
MEGTSLYKSFLLLCAMMISCVALAVADPDPERCTVLPSDNLGHSLLFAPQNPSPIAAAMETITVRDSNNNPLPNMSVSYNYEDVEATHLTLCQGQPGSCEQRGLVTNSNGVTIYAYGNGGGGKWDYWFDQILIYVNHEYIIRYDEFKSPDWDGIYPSDLQMRLADLLCFRGSCPFGDHDYDNNGSMNLSDLMIFSSAYVPTHSCPRP